MYLRRTQSKGLRFAPGLFNDNNLSVHHYFQLGHLHLPIFGILAALGLMAALALSQRTARYANLAPEAVWNACTVAVLAAFVISRLLLIVFNLDSFLKYPLLVLALPSLTTTGIILTAIFVWAYIHWRAIPLRPLLDAVAPCAILLWAILSLGRTFDGTRDGMPTNLPWGVHDPGTGSVHPVELYAFLAASLVCLTVFLILRAPHDEGKATAIALVSSGLAIFSLDFFHLPSDLLPNSPLDPSQIIGITLILVGAAFFLRTQSKIERERRTEPPHAI